MRIAFRADASSRMGSGHVVRCLALARALRVKGAECSFIHRLHPGHTADAIRGDGFEVHELSEPALSTHAIPDGDYEGWLGASEEEDAQETAEVLGDEPVDWLVVDHYALSERWEDTMRPRVEQLAVIDDLANRGHDCDLLLDQNFFSEGQRRYEELVPSRCRVLTGPRYALMKPEYAEVRRIVGPRRGPASRVLVFYGGADRSDQTSRALRVLSHPEFRHLGVDVVLGVNHPNREGVHELAARRARTDVHEDLDHLAGLMAEADVALGAGGATTWERCATGLPSVVTAVAENQLPFSQALAADDRIVFLGRAETTTEDDLAEALRELIQEPNELHALARRAWRVTDGQGALRVAESLMPTAREELTLRPACAHDKFVYFDWANDPEARRQAFNPDPIPWTEHSRWFDRRLQDENSWLFVLQTPQGLPVGQVRIDREGDDGVLSYSVDPAFRGRGWGTVLLERAVEAREEFGMDCRLSGTVLAGNTPSHRAFLRAGFQEVGRGEQGKVEYSYPSSPSAKRPPPTENS